MEGFAALYIFMLAAFTGYEVIARVPVILHTPLMSGSNFVHGIVLVGAMVAMGHAEHAEAVAAPCGEWVRQPLEGQDEQDAREEIPERDGIGRHRHVYFFSPLAFLAGSFFLNISSMRSVTT